MRAAQSQTGSTAFKLSVAVCIVLIAVLSCFFVSPLKVLLFLLAAAYLWIPFRKPLLALGIVLVWMPFDFMFIALGKFYGLPHMTLVSILDKEGILLLLFVILWHKNGFRLTPADCFLLASFGFAAIRTAFSGTLDALVIDFAFLIPYFVGRVTVLTEEQQHLWAKCAVWLTGTLAMLGLIEVFVFGEGPRTLLYLAIDSETEGGHLTSSFHAAGFTGLREAATMVGPNGFGALCMVALILWWVYSRDRLPAFMVVVGLICSVTRSAWLGTLLSIPLLAYLMEQRKRLLTYAAIGVTLFVVSIPILGLSGYLSDVGRGQDPSVDWHREGIIDGTAYAASHPLGSGNQSIGPAAYQTNGNALVFETTYPALAAEYGVVTILCFIGFLVTAAHRIWQCKSSLSYAALGILIGIVIVMAVAIPINDRRLDAWIWVPIGMAIAYSTRSPISQPFTSGNT